MQKLWAISHKGFGERNTEVYVGMGAFLPVLSILVLVSICGWSIWAQLENREEIKLMSQKLENQGRMAAELKGALELLRQETRCYGLMKVENKKDNGKDVCISK